MTEPNEPDQILIDTTEIKFNAMESSNTPTYGPYATLGDSQHSKLLSR